MAMKIPEGCNVIDDKEMEKMDGGLSDKAVAGIVLGAVSVVSAAACIGAACTVSNGGANEVPGAMPDHGAMFSRPADSEASISVDGEHLCF